MSDEKSEVHRLRMECAEAWDIVHDTADGRLDRMVVHHAREMRELADEKAKLEAENKKLRELVKKVLGEPDPAYTEDDGEPV